MKKIVLVCGLIAGVIVSAMMLISVAMCYQNDNYEGNMLLGYAAMLLAFSLVYVGIRNYRDRHNNGIISFINGFKIGLNITLIASTMYVVIWLVDYYVFVPDFMDRYADYMVNQTRAKGGSTLEVERKMAEMASLKEMYKNPLMVVLISYSEILPVGLVITLVSALLLKRK